MKISLATNYDNNLIDEIKDYPIYEIYGKMKNDFIGGGRPDNSLENLEKIKFEEHVKKVRSAGINFNYLFNGSCLADKEQDEKFRKELIEFLTYLKGIGVNALTITNPFILMIVKKYFDCFIVRVSTFACVDSYEKAKYWEDMGADIICVDFTKINRDFKQLKYMIKNLKKAKIELLVTNSCLKNCPYIYTHTNQLAHASNKYDETGCFEDWCLLTCQKHELENSYEYIKSPWIRPEDIKYYEEIGVEHFKLTERGFPTKELVKRVKAYCEGHYEGNLIDLIQGHGWSNDENKLLKIEHKNLNTRKEVLNEIIKIRGMGCERKYPRHVYIDNSKLDGFIKFFIEEKCTGYCSNCNYCKRYAEKAIIENKEVKEYLKELYDKYDNLKI